MIVETSKAEKKKKRTKSEKKAEQTIQELWDNYKKNVTYT